MPWKRQLDLPSHVNIAEEREASFGGHAYLQIAKNPFHLTLFPALFDPLLEPFLCDL